MKAIKNPDGTFEVPQNQDVIKHIVNPENLDNTVLSKNGIYDYVLPTLKEGEILGALYLSNNKVTHKIEKIIESPNEVYKQKVSELRAIKESFLFDLSEIATKKTLRGDTISPELKTFFKTVETIETRVEKELQEMLQKNDLSGLKKYSFQSKEVEWIKTKIKAFKQ